MPVNDTMTPAWVHACFHAPVRCIWSGSHSRTCPSPLFGLPQLQWWESGVMQSGRHVSSRRIQVQRHVEWDESRTKLPFLLLLMHLFLLQRSDPTLQALVHDSRIHRRRLALLLPLRVPMRMCMCLRMRLCLRLRMRMGMRVRSIRHRCLFRRLGLGLDWGWWARATRSSRPRRRYGWCSSRCGGRSASGRWRRLSTRLDLLLLLRLPHRRLVLVVVLAIEDGRVVGGGCRSAVHDICAAARMRRERNAAEKGPNDFGRWMESAWSSSRISSRGGSPHSQLSISCSLASTCPFLGYVSSGLSLRLFNRHLVLLNLSQRAVHRRYILIRPISGARAKFWRNSGRCLDPPSAQGVIPQLLAHEHLVAKSHRFELI
jgi:hypothetical protein